MAEGSESRVFLAHLFNSISPGPGTDNPLATAAENDRKLLLTLHVLFPNELLPALDLLDRRLMTRMSVRQDQDGQANVAHAPEDVGPHDRSSSSSSSNTVYHVRSAQQKASSSRFHDAAASTYEVRLAAWNCSCPAFAFAAFPPSPDDGGGEEEEEEKKEADAGGATEAVVSGSLTDVLSHSTTTTTTTGSAAAAGTADAAAGAGTWLFGGLTKGDGAVPACKHLLACVLVERCRMFGGFAGERGVSLEEAAGWAAGWMG